MNFFPPFIGINEKFVNLNSIAVIEDQSTDQESKATIITSDGAEIELTGDDADLLFDRMEMVSFASDAIFATLQLQFDATKAADAGETADDDNI